MYMYVIKSFKTQQGRIPIDTAILAKDQPMSVLPADPMTDVFFGTSADVRSDPMFSVDINNALKNANSC